MRTAWLTAVRKTTGYVLFVLSCLGWAVLPVIPFLPISGAAKAAWVAAALIFAEVAWWLMVVLLGKEVIEYCRRGWQRLRLEWQRWRRRAPVAHPADNAPWPPSTANTGPTPAADAASGATHERQA